MHLIETLMTDQIFSCLCQQFLLDNVPHVFSDIYMCIVYSQRRYMMGGEKKLRASDWSPEFLWLHECGHCLCERNHLTQYSTNSL